MKSNLFWRLFITVAVSLMLLTACGGGGGGGEAAPPGNNTTCVWDSSNWDSGCVWG